MTLFVSHDKITSAAENARTAYIKSVGFPWTAVTGTTQAAAVNNGYIANNAALVTVTLPATASVGQRVAVAGYGAGMWTIAQNANQYIIFQGSTSTTGVGGSVAATTRYDCIEIVCVVANNGWLVTSAVGTLTVT
jgi:hypothetical protein